VDEAAAGPAAVTEAELAVVLAAPPEEALEDALEDDRL
jgi:hypothetical protein